VTLNSISGVSDNGRVLVQTRSDICDFFLLRVRVERLPILSPDPPHSQRNISRPRILRRKGEPDRREDSRATAVRSFLLRFDWVSSPGSDTKEITSLPRRGHEKPGVARQSILLCATRALYPTQISLKAPDPHDAALAAHFPLPLLERLSARIYNIRSLIYTTTSKATRVFITHH
jgi:hypothetical protein